MVSDLTPWGPGLGTGHEKHVGGSSGAAGEMLGMVQKGGNGG